MKKIEIVVVFAISLSVYLITAAGYIDTIDADASFETAKAITREGRWSVTPQKPDYLIYFPSKANENRWISKMGFIHPLLYIPAVIAGDITSRLTNISGDLVQRFLISLVNPFLSACIISLFYFFLRKKNLKPSQAALFTVWLGLGTLLWPYSKSCHRDVFVALAFLASFGFFAIERLVLGGVFIALGVLAKPITLIPFTPLIGLVIFGDQPWKKKFHFAIPILLSLMIWIGTNWYWSGNGLSFGFSKQVTQFDSQVWKTPMLSGIFQQLFALETGLFIFDPLLAIALSIMAFQLFRQRSRDPFFIGILSTFAVTILVYSRWWSPTGDNALGPRYLVSMVPLLLLGIAFHFKNIAFKSCVVPLLLMVIFQALQTSIKPQLYGELRRRSEERLPLPHPIANLKLFSLRWKDPNGCIDSTKLGGMQPACISVTDARTLRGFNYWWWHLRHS